MDSCPELLYRVPRYPAPRDCRLLGSGPREKQALSAARTCGTCVGSTRGGRRAADPSWPPEVAQAPTLAPSALPGSDPPATARFLLPGERADLGSVPPASAFSLALPASPALLPRPVRSGKKGWLLPWTSCALNRLGAHSGRRG